ncbi:MULTISPECIES: amidohydrolase family protein [Halobacterium]|nr:MULTISPECIES: amidohydrolase family protein [Halobacterium]MBB6090585.1 cytosine/adenosine deaminase-related metal-dependent hydrolase [Halobacterium salinarum]MCF2208057.1 amidohydrolase family protein [Halobacterium salinarum]MCF2240949.1 amidohydrolase family protein [Halobacterium salinarum]MDL0119939.1 amidohydrolase family protein [Halobacterium salinarum]MDL0121244.1 amidohydrolase family protein [Halobacterium salinarum]
MTELAGTVLAGDAFEPTRGRVVIDDGRIDAVEEDTHVDSEDIILPAFVNAHTHLGDSIAKEAAVGLSLDDAVAPPNSLKHRRLAAADDDDLVAAMRHTLTFMHQTGTVACLDFRESGRPGTEALRAAADTVDVTPFIFGSGDPDVLDIADGYGASGANDNDFADERAACTRRDAPFAIHAGEPDATDIHPALDLEPDLLVHMVHAEDTHLTRVADQSVPIAVCPRANTVLDVGDAPIPALLDHTTVALGTDNVMLNPPSMFREMATTAKRFDVSATDVLRMATTAGAEIAGLDCGVIEPGRRAALVVLDGDSHNLRNAVDPVQAVVRRATGLDVKRVLT